MRMTFQAAGGASAGSADGVRRSRGGNVPVGNVARAAGARPRRRPEARGFSLVEVLCAILILGVGLAGLTEGIAEALRSTKEAQLQTSAVLFAEGQIELLRAEGYLTAGSSEGECGPSVPNCRWRRSVANADLDGLFEVSVVISERTGKDVCELKTLVFESPSSTPRSEGGTSPSRERETQRRERQRQRGRGAG